MAKKKNYCSFCGREEDEVERLVQSPEEDDVFICNECIEDSAELIGSVLENMIKMSRIGKLRC